MAEIRIPVLLAVSGLALAASAAVGQSEPFPAVLDLGDLDGEIGFFIEGGGIAAFFGRSVGAAGDLNNDGLGDIMIGASREGSGGGAYAVFGRSGGFPRTVDVGDLNGINGLFIEGAAPGDRAGAAVGGALDINNDGIDDAIVAAPSADGGGRTDSGQVFLIYGRDPGVVGPFVALFNLASIDGINGFGTISLEGFGLTGFSVFPAGDTNGDDIDDVIIGAPGADGPGGEDAGESYVVYGRDATVSGMFPPSLDLDTIDSSTGFVMRGESTDNRAGSAVGSVGDVNGDGLGDVIVGAQAYYYAAGKSYVVFGDDDRAGFEIDLGSLDGSDGFALLAPAGVYGRSGQAVAGLGDINGDGIDDFAVAAPSEETASAYSAGVTRVVFGRAGGFPATVDLEELDGTNGFKIEGELEFDVSGHAVDSGDVNGDGLIDIVLGAPYGYGDGVERAAGRVYVLFGESDGFPPVVRLGELDGDNGFRIDGAGDYDRTGFAAAVAGDMNGDGVDDIVIGTYPRPGDGEERAYVVFGRQVAASCPADLDGDGDLTIFDFLAFQNLFDLMDLRADFDGDGDFTIFDFLAFQNAFDLGC